MKRVALVAVVLIVTILLGCSPKAPVALPPTQEATITSAIEETPTTNTTSTQSPVPQETPGTPTLTPAPTTTSTTPATPTGLYTGPLFDAHLHLDSMYSPYPTLSRLKSAEELLSYLDRGGVDWVIGMYSLPPDKTSVSWGSTAETIVGGASKRVIPLLAPNPKSEFVSGHFNEVVLRQYVKPQGLFWGVGEITMYRPELQSVTFDSAVMQTVFRVVNELKGIVMVHPSEVIEGGRPTEPAEVEPSISKYPDTIFLFHGKQEAFNTIAPLMSKYPNVYFSIDSGPWMFSSSQMRKNVLTKDSSTAESFLADVNQVGFDRLLEENFKKVAPLIQQYPDRILWGTDLVKSWQFESSVTDMVIRMSREFIGKLPTAIQEKYAYKNAQKVFERFLAPK